MDDWLLHMTEAQRIYAVDLIEAMLVALDKPLHIPIPRWANATTVSVHSLPDRRPGASVILSRGNVILRTPMSPRRFKFAAEIIGPSSHPTDAFPTAGSDVFAMRVTLAGWLAALSSPVTDAVGAKVGTMRSAVTTLLRGAAHAHRPDWRWRRWNPPATRVIPSRSFTARWTVDRCRADLPPKLHRRPTAA